MRYRRLDLSKNPNIPELTQLFRDGSEIEEPQLMLRHFAPWFGRTPHSDVLVSISRRGLAPGKFKITRRMTREQRLNASQIEAPNPWKTWDSIPELEGGFLGEVITLEEPQFITGIDLSDDPHLSDLPSIRAALAIPHFDKGEALNWAVFLIENPEPPSLQDVEQAMLSGSLLGLATKNLVSKKEAEHLSTELQRQFEQVAGIQRALLPHRLPSLPGMALATSYLTSDQAGGDYYDFFRFTDTKWGILIADVAGHGAAAATVMAMLRAILHCYDRGDASPATMMEYANTKLLAANLVGSFITAFFAIYDAERDAIDFARCGHNPPRIRRASGEVIELDGDGGLPLGIDDELGVRTASVRLEQGDTLILYTDGITEAFDADREMFGVECLDRAIQESDGTPQGVVDAIHEAVYAHTGVMHRFDDQTLVILQRITDEQQA